MPYYPTLTELDNFTKLHNEGNLSDNEFQLKKIEILDNLFTVKRDCDFNLAYNDLEKLGYLITQGVVLEEEFDTYKNKILKHIVVKRSSIAEVTDILAKAATLRDGKIINEQTYDEFKEYALSKTKTNVIEPRPIPLALWLVPIFLGVIGGVIAAIISNYKYKTAKGALIIGGILFTIIWFIVLLLPYLLYT